MKQAFAKSKISMITLRGPEKTRQEGVDTHVADPEQMDEPTVPIADWVWGLSSKGKAEPFLAEDHRPATATLARISPSFGDPT